jgi:hypothetical protein
MVAALAKNEAVVLCGAPNLAFLAALKACYLINLADILTFCCHLSSCCLLLSLYFPKKTFRGNSFPATF